FATLREQIGELSRAVQARQAERLAGDKDVERVGQEHARVQRHVETVEAESRQVAREADETTATLARLSQRIAAARNAEGALEAAVARGRDASESAQTDATANDNSLNVDRERLRVDSTETGSSDYYSTTV